jgi:signal transduction histidine kinase
MQNLSPEETAELSRDLHTSASNLYKLLRNLLDWARIQRGLLDESPEPVFLRPLTDDAVDLASLGIHEKGLSVEVDMPDGLKGWGNDNMLSTVLRNLISNAVKFTSPGGSIRITGRIRETVPPDAGPGSHGMVEIAVQDSGIGMDPETVNKLFTIEGSMESRRRGESGDIGTGLGLLLCKELTEKMGGALEVESEPDRGSTFRVILRASGTAS